MAVKKDEKTGTWYFYGSYKMKNGKYRQYKKRGFQKKKDAIKASYLKRTLKTHTKMSHLRNCLISMQHIQKRE